MEISAMEPKVRKKKQEMANTEFQSILLTVKR